MTRGEHLAWAKARALAELEPGGGGWVAALNSIQADFRQHPDLEGHAGLGLMAELALHGHLSTPEEVREFIGGLS